MFKYPLAAILVMAASASLAQVKVVDSEPTIGAMPPPSVPAGSLASAEQNSSSGQNSSGNAAQLYYQLQQLQQEVQQLRGMVEQQAHQLKQLKQQRMDDYLDLDRRLSQLQSGQSSGEPERGNASAAAPAGKDELSDYRAAIDLVLKQQDYDRGIEALKQHLDAYPKGRYAANAQYWLGQIYLLKDQLEESRQWFVAMLRDHPQHQKAPEAKFKLGKVYHLLGDDTKARSLLEEVAASGTSAASLAKDYLRQNFSS